jgi:amino acid transporter
MAGTVGGTVWLPFLLAVIVATLTAFSYLELVTQYPQAAGAALYTDKAFGIHFVTFLVAFAVVFTSPGPIPLVAAVLCAFRAGPSVGRNVIQYQMAGGLMAIGAVFRLVTWLINERTNTGEGEPVGIQS